MRIDAIVIDPNLPDWANGQLADVAGKKLLLLQQHPKLQWPRWYHRLGRAIGWKWLAQWRMT